MREKNNFHGISSVYLPRPPHLTLENLALSSFSRKWNSVKTKVVQLLHEIYQFESCQKPPGRQVRARSWKASTVNQWLEESETALLVAGPLQEPPLLHPLSLGCRLCQVSDEHFNMVVL